jgi:hypothetical protein
MRLNDVKNVVGIVLECAQCVLKGGGVKSEKLGGEGGGEGVQMESGVHNERRGLIFERVQGLELKKHNRRVTCRFFMTSGSSPNAPALEERAVPLTEFALEDDV